jgi:hypothetical protein
VSAAAERQRRYRARQRAERFWGRIEIDWQIIDALVDDGRVGEWDATNPNHEIIEMAV